MDLTVLGCSGSVPGPASPASGYVVSHDGYRVVLERHPATPLHLWSRPEMPYGYRMLRRLAAR